MAKERYSNEVIAQVLTQVIKNLQTELEVQRKAMAQHVKSVEEATSKPMKVPEINLQPLKDVVAELREERKAIEAVRDVNMKLLGQIDVKLKSGAEQVKNVLQESTAKSIETLKKSDTFSGWSWKLMYVGAGMIVFSVIFFFLSFKMNQSNIIEEQKKEIENYVKFIDETPNARKIYDDWLNKNEKR